MGQLGCNNLRVACWELLVLTHGTVQCLERPVATGCRGHTVAVIRTYGGEVLRLRDSSNKGGTRCNIAVVLIG